MIKFYQLILTISFLYLTSCNGEQIETEYFESGSVKLTGSAINGQKEGVWYGLVDLTGDTSRILNYNNGELIYEETISIQGSKTTTELKNGVKHGNLNHYYPTGELAFENQWNNGKLVGRTLEYYISGQLKYIGFYDSNHVTSKFYAFYENGLLQEHLTNLYEGKTYQYDSMGELKQIVRVLNSEYSDTLYQRAKIAR